jgi:hypothetical protein
MLRVKAPRNQNRRHRQEARASYKQALHFDPRLVEAEKDLDALSGRQVTEIPDAVERFRLGVDCTPTLTKLVA